MRYLPVNSDSLFQYSVTRTFTLPYLTPFIVSIGLVYITFITLFAIITVGYELQAELSVSFNTTLSMWYDFLPKTSLMPVSRICLGSVIKVGEGLTPDNDINYQLVDFLDPDKNQFDGMTYSNNALQHCSVAGIGFSQNVPSTATIGDSAATYFACNTTANQYIDLLSTRAEAVTTNELVLKTNAPSAFTEPGPLNISQVLGIWQFSEARLLETIDPYQQDSILLPSCEVNNLSFISLYYLDYSEVLSPIFGFLYRGEQANTLADDHWWLTLSYKFSNSSEVMRNLNISFLATGDIDLQRTAPQDLALANTLLAPTITLLRSQISSDFDFWKMINWLTVSIHWTFLYNLGQTAPTTYTPNIGSQPVISNFSNPIFYSDKNNIFVNDTLFEIYSTYLRETILPIFNTSSPEFSPLNETNRFYPQQTTFVRSYNCQQRVLKSGWIFSVFSVDFAFASGAYTLVLLVAGFIERRRQKRRQMNSNYCEGCIILMNRQQDVELDRLIELATHGPLVTPTRVATI